MEISNRSSGKPSKASLTSVSPCRKIPDRSVPKFILKQTQLCYRMSDVLVSLVIVFPLVIGFWRGVWNLMEYYSKLYGVDPWLCIGVGYSIPFFLYWLQEPLRKHIRPRKMNFVLFYITSRYLLLLHSFGSVNQWRGLWELLDQQLGTGLYSALGSLVLGVAFSMMLKTFCNVLAPPLYIAVDEAYAIHDCPLRFHTPPKLKCSYLLDCLVSVILAASLVVLSWRGLWELADLYLYPDEQIISAVTSLAFGYALVLLLLTCQPYINKTIERLEGWLRLIFADLVTFVGFVGCVFAWRGLWMLYDEYLGTLSGNWVTCIIGGLGSMILGCISTVVVRGVAVDGEVSDNGSSGWPIPYITLLRDSIYDVPFPEPWLFRYLCTPQKMNCHPLKTKTAKEATQKEMQGAQLNAKANLVSVETGETETAKMLQQDVTTIPLRNIDSSTDDEEEQDHQVRISITNPTRDVDIVRGNASSESLPSESYELKSLRKVNNAEQENANVHDRLNLESTSAMLERHHSSTSTASSSPSTSLRHKTQDVSTE
ncbi:unnamed protein product [Allacma fusca]|uniref:Uncharacterized protein n=1 Tax=Allacma fusca TaxID=39272 RepID=A0A8J2PTY8_9HEXA|nr:unnamed protein product [Allacma fusca]